MSYVFGDWLPYTSQIAYKPPRVKRKGLGDLPLRPRQKARALEYSMNDD